MLVTSFVFRMNLNTYIVVAIFLFFSGCSRMHSTFVFHHYLFLSVALRVSHFFSYPLSSFSVRMIVCHSTTMILCLLRLGDSMYIQTIYTCKYTTYTNKKLLFFAHTQRFYWHVRLKINIKTKDYYHKQSHYFSICNVFFSTIQFESK